MRPRNLLVLFLLVAGLGAFIYFVDKDFPSSDELAREEDKVLSLDADEITAVTLAHEGDKVRLERTPAEKADGETTAPGAWGLVHPLVARADQAAVDRLVSSLTGLRADRKLTEYDAAGLGLESPRVIVTLGTAKGETTVRVGAEIPASSTMVVAVDGRKPAYVVDRAVVTDLLRPARDWRARDLFPGSRPEIRTVALSTEARTLVVQRHGERDDFWFEDPATGISDRLAEDRADELLGALTALKAERFLDPPAPPASELGLEPPETTVEVSFQEGPDFHLELGKAVPGTEGRYYGRIGEHLYEISTPLPQLARGEVQRWRSLAWSALPVYLVDGGTLTLEGSTFELHRDGTDWRRGDELIGYDKVSELLYAINEVKAEEILPSSQSARLPAEPKLRLHLTTSSSAEEDLSLYMLDGKAVARTEGRDVLLLLPAKTGDDVLRLAAELRDAPAQPDKPPGDGDDDQEATDADDDA